jgi:hypothetical protein
MGVSAKSITHTKLIFVLPFTLIAKVERSDYYSYRSAPPIYMKQCTSCKEIKDRNLFVKRKKSKDGLDSYCKECWAFMCRIRRQEKSAKRPYKTRKPYVQPVLKYHLIKCQFCDTKVERNINVKKATCITCKEGRRTEAYIRQKNKKTT